MKKIAVLGTGNIGCLLGSYISHAGYDLTMISAFRRGTAEFLSQNGLSIGDLHGEPGNILFHTDIKAVFIDDLTDEKFNIVLVALKSNDLEIVVPKMLPHLSKEGYFVPFENGINEDLLIPLVGQERLVIGSTFAGGGMKAPGYMCSHEGFFVVGEISGKITERAQELGTILECCRPTIVADNARSYQWEKMGRVCLSVPCACISGLFLGDVFMELRLQKLFAFLALEIFAVAREDGCPMDSLENKSYEDWVAVSEGHLTGLEGRDPGNWAPGIVDAYTSDIRKGLPLEIVNTNGAVSRLGHQYGIPTPANDGIVRMIEEIRDGKRERGFSNVEELVEICTNAHSN